MPSGEAPMHGHVGLIKKHPYLKPASLMVFLDRPYILFSCKVLMFPSPICLLAVKCTQFRVTGSITRLFDGFTLSVWHTAFMLEAVTLPA